MTVSVPRIEKLLAEATERPWWSRFVPASYGLPAGWHVRSEQLETLADFGDDESAERDAALICEAVNALPVLIAAVKALDVCHEFQCGCSEPGRFDVCVAEPRADFEALAPFSFEEQAASA